MTFKNLTRAEDIMKDLGWQFVPTGPEEWTWIKFDKFGRAVAYQGDEVWRRDCNIARF